MTDYETYVKYVGEPWIDRITAGLDETEAKYARAMHLRTIEQTYARPLAPPLVIDVEVMQKRSRAYSYSLKPYASLVYDIAGGSASCLTEIEGDTVTGNGFDIFAYAVADVLSKVEYLCYAVGIAWAKRGGLKAGAVDSVLGLYALIGDRDIQFCGENGISPILRAMKRLGYDCVRTKPRKTGAGDTEHLIFTWKGNGKAMQEAGND